MNDIDVRFQDCGCSSVSRIANSSVISVWSNKARIFLLQGTADVTTIINMSLTAKGMRNVIVSPKSALAFVWHDALIARNVTVVVLNSTFEAISTLVNIDSASRTQSIIDISGCDQVTDVRVTAVSVVFKSTLESGGCTAAVVSVVNLFDNVSDSSIYAANIYVLSRIVNGTLVILQNILAAMTMSTAIVWIMMQIPAYVNVGVGINVTVVSATIDVLHSTTIPPTVTCLIAGSSVSIVNIARSMSNSAILVSNSSITRRFLPFMLPPGRT